MKKTRIIVDVVILIFTVSPLLYLLFVWKSVPETMLVKFNFNEMVEKEQSKQSVLITAIAISAISAGIYFLLRNLSLVDPKVKPGTPRTGFNRMALSVTIFLVILNYFYILSAVHAWEISKKVHFIFFGMLMAVLGNYMHHLRPNFFAGIRLPWTLSDENNWRQTHQLAGKLWFFGGLLLALISSLLPEFALQPVFITFIVLLVLIPGIYSYRLFRNKN